MTIRRARGFTLIELLVVIAIIGILAAMLFPVFARARESARKIQCLANVKNIALAIQMYFTDYDKGPPWETRPEVHDYFATYPGGGSVFDPPCGNMTDHANPYLRDPVILDEYIKNRDIWRCPSARMQGGAMLIYGWPDWFAELRAYEGQWGNGRDLCPKDGAYPNGWGGSVTDSFKQNQLANGYWAQTRDTGANGVFMQSIATNMSFHDLATSTVRDAAQFVTCHDAGACVDYDSPGLVAYPDLCAAECNSEWCAWADWANCAQYCGDFIYSLPPAGGAFAKDGELMKPFTRHLGGSNLGFMDGHAKWMSARAFVNDCIEQGKKGIPDPFGLWPWSGGYPQWCGDCDPCIARFYKPG
jgi:prepilin-type N-terminal cleavage/methylation domain-containing protein/prepilin-type processing-associated H-X9-DG protein